MDYTAPYIISRGNSYRIENNKSLIKTSIEFRNKNISTLIRNLEYESLSKFCTIAIIGSENYTQDYFG